LLHLDQVECGNKRVPVDQYIELYGTGKLPRKYERTLERYFNTKDKKEMLRKSMRMRVVPVLCPHKVVELIDKDSGDMIEKVAQEILEIARDINPSRRVTAAEGDELKGMKQWTTGDGLDFRPAGNTMPNLPPGYYECKFSPMSGYYLSSIPIRTTDLIRFPETSISSVVGEIKKFWTKEDDFRRAGLTFKRGLLLYGPPGTGKSCTIQLAIADVHERGGVAIKLEDPDFFLECVRMFRAVQPTTPLVVVMEDLDALLERYSQTSILNLLDGVEGLEWVVFLATTNYPEKLGARIINRPSRFDRRFEVPALGEKSRAIYLKHLFGKYRPENDIDIDKWVADTEGMSVSHLKELFVGVMILEDDYEEVTQMLRDMQDERPESNEYMTDGAQSGQMQQDSLVDAAEPQVGPAYYGRLKEAASKLI
jgi:hypothetical protein